MSSFVSDVKKVSLNDVLSTPINAGTIKAVDLSVDTFKMDPGVKFTNQERLFGKFEIKIYPDIDKIVENNVFGYKLKIYDPTVGDVGASGMASASTIENLVFSFYDDFPGIMDTGEVNFTALVESVKSPEVEVISSEALGSSTSDGLSPGTDFSLSDSSSGVEYGSATAGFTGEEFVTPIAAVEDFTESSVVMITSGIDPDDAAELSMPSFPIASNNWGLAAHGDTLGFADYQKRKESLQPTLGDRISLTGDRQFKLEKYFPPIVDPAVHAHEFSALPENHNQDLGIIDLGAQILTESSYFTSCRRVEIPKSLLAAEVLAFEFVPIVSDGRGEVNSSLEHYDEIEAEPILLTIVKTDAFAHLLAPEVPPSIHAKVNKPGFISYAVKRNDLLTDSVSVSLSYIDVRTGEIIYEKGQTHTFSGIKDEMAYGKFHGCKNKMPYVARLTASVVSPSGVSLSTNEVLTKIPNDHFINRHHNGIMLYTFNDTSGVNIHINKAFGAPTPVRAGVFREDLTLPLSSPSRIKKITEISSFPSTEFIVTDTSPLPDRMYRYFVRAVVKDVLSNRCRVQYEIESSSDEITLYKRDEDSTFYDVSLATLSTATTNKFKPNVNLNSNNFNLIIDALNSKGIAKYFVDEIKSTKPNFENLVFFVVDRLDKGTGKRETIGTCPSNAVFEDITASTLRSYVYIFKMAVLPPTAAIILSGRTEEAKTVLGEEAFADASKALSSVYSNNSGVILDVSDLEQIKTPTGVLELGLTGFEMVVSTSASLQKISPIIYEIGVVPTSREVDGIKFAWSMEAESMTEIDCFYVYCVYQGKSTVIKTVTAHPLIASYYCTESLYYNEIGQKRYYVRAKYKDNKFGPKSADITKNRVSMIPSDLIDKVKIIKASTDPEAHRKVALTDILPPGMKTDVFF